MTLLEFLDGHYLPGRPISEGAAVQLRVAVRRFHAFTGRPVALHELTAELVKGWLNALTDSQSPATVNGKRSAILCLWAAAHRAGLTGPVPDLPMAPAVNRAMVAWTVEDVRRIIANCQGVKGRFRSSGILKSDFLRSLLLFLYDTGSRLSEAKLVRPSDIQLDAKSARLGPLVFQLSDATISAIERHWDPTRELVWPFGMNRHGLWESLRSVLRASGLPSDRYHMFDCVRRTTLNIVMATVPQARGQSRSFEPTFADPAPLNVLPPLEEGAP